SRLLVGKRSQLAFKALERQPGQVAQLRSAAPREPGLAQSRERRSGDPLGLGRTGSRAIRRAGAEALGQMAEARHAGSKRELLTADAVRQGLEEGRKSLRPQPGAAPGELGEPSLVPHPMPERRQIGLEREQPRHERSYRAPVVDTGRRRLKGNPRSALFSAQEG